MDDPAAACAELIAESASAGHHIALTGGSTPKRAYEQAASLGADWSGAKLWWGDERCVPPDDSDSNYGMAKEALLDRLEEPLPEVHRIRAEHGPSGGADDYERELRASLGEETPRLDLLLLGLGPDAHVASLYPGHDTLDERHRLAVPVPEPGWKPFVPRVSLTLPVLCAARRIVFLVTGEDKARAVEQSFDQEPSRDAPGSLVRPVDGELILLLDEAAASRLPRAG